MNRTPEVEELVLAFDTLAKQDYPGGVPRRSTAPDRVAVVQVLGNLLLVAGALLALFWVLRRLALAWQRLRATRTAVAERRAEVGAALSEAAGALLTTRPDGKGRRAAEDARRGELYVQALTAFEGARTLRQLQGAEDLVHEVLSGSAR